MKKLLITGASGFLGGRAVRFYNGKYEIFAPSHSELDITDAKSVCTLFDAVKPDLVIHSAAISDVGICEKEPEMSWKINVDGSRNIAAASARLRSKCLLCSSDQVYFGSGIKEAHKEDEAIHPANIYGQEKKQAEEECLEANPSCVILRLSWMYDTAALHEKEHGDFFRTLISGLHASSTLSYPVHDIRGITDVNEVIQNFGKTWELEGGIYNFGSPNNKNTYETVHAMFTELGWDTDRLEKNEEAFASNPRNISMCPNKLNNNGISFSSTLDALVRKAKLSLPLA